MAVVMNLNIIVILKQEIPYGITAGALLALALHVVIVVVIPHLDSHTIAAWGCRVVYSNNMDTNTSLNRGSKHRSCCKEGSGELHVVRSREMQTKIAMWFEARHRASVWFENSMAMVKVFMYSPFRPYLSWAYARVWVSRREWTNAV